MKIFNFGQKMNYSIFKYGNWSKYTRINQCLYDKLGQSIYFKYVANNQFIIKNEIILDEISKII
jgi:hypothetical protein